MNTLNKILTVALVTFSTSTFAQKIASTAVPENVMHKFQKDFPTAKDVDWKKDGLNYHADFEIANKDVDVWYSSDAKFIKKKSELVKEDLPKEVIAVIDSNYKDYKTDEIEKHVLGSTVTYLVELESKAGSIKVTFDKAGKVLNTTNDK